MWKKNVVVGNWHSSKKKISDRCDLTWHDKLQAQTDTVRPLLDQYPGLTPPDAIFRSVRQVKMARIAVSAAHDRRINRH